MDFTSLYWRTLVLITLTELCALNELSFIHSLFHLLLWVREAGGLKVHMLNLLFFLSWYQMSSALFLTPTVLSMWRLPGTRGGRSRDSSSLSMG